MAQGALPWLLPYLQNNESHLHTIVEYCDGLMLTGGGDPSPACWNEEPRYPISDVVPERDETEILLIRAFVEKKKPILALCRGCQMLNIALGGDIYQDIPRQYEGALQHRQTSSPRYLWHHITIKTGTLLSRCYQPPRQSVNSDHHQAIRKLAEPLVVTATAQDGVVEAVEGKDSSHFMVGVQWHPEWTFPGEGESDRKLFSIFVEECKKNKGPKAPV